MRPKRRYVRELCGFLSGQKTTGDAEAKVVDLARPLRNASKILDQVVYMAVCRRGPVASVGVGQQRASRGFLREQVGDQPRGRSEPVEAPLRRFNVTRGGVLGLCVYKLVVNCQAT
jgi:hypothetical protein